MALLGVREPFRTAEGWWTFSVLFTNFVSIALLIWLLRREGKRYRDMLHFTRETFWKDLGIALILFLLAAPISTLPNLWLAERLFGSGQVAMDLFFRPLPLWAALVSILMPITIAFAELPTYFGYAMPRLEKQLANGWLAYALASFALAFQHVAFPLIFDASFMVWRIAMFIPFAFYIGLCIKLRPRLLPFLMVGHALIDMSLIAILFTLGTT